MNISHTHFFPPRLDSNSCTLIFEKLKFNMETTALEFIPLNNALCDGDVDKVSALLGSGECNVNCADSNGFTPLHIACELGHSDMVRVLVSEFKADTAIQNNNGITALMLATLHGHVQVVQALLCEHQCAVDVKDNKGDTILHYACQGGSVSLVQTLIQEYKADVNAYDDLKYTPLSIAVLYGNLEVALSLINNFGCDLNVRDCLGRSLLHNACQGGSVSLVQTLIQEHTADVNACDDQKHTPLSIAALYGNAKVALCLIVNYGCDLNVRGNIGMSILHNACEGGSVSLVQTLIREHKADINDRDDHNNLPLHVAAFTGKAEIALSLINDFACDPNTRGNIGRSLLHNACQGGSVNLVQTLIQEHKADVNACDDLKYTPLSIAALSGKAEVALSLISNFGCDPNVRDHLGRSLLHNACQGGSVNLVQTLIQEHKADVNACDDLKYTPLSIAALSGKAEVALSLISNFGCDPNVRDHLGRSLLHNACEGGSVSLVQTLIQKHKADINARDDLNDTPLCVAALYGKAEVALSLISNFGCDPNATGNIGQSVLHNACAGGSVSLVQTLICEHKACVNARDDQNNMPLHVAASGKTEVALSLINNLCCDPNVKGNLDRSLLHIACQGGCIRLVQTLIRVYKFNINDRDNENNTPLIIAAGKGRAEIALSLINDFGCDPNVRGNIGRSLLHYACQGGSVSLVQTLIREHKADVNARDDQNNTPLHVAAFSGKADVAFSLINDFGCDPNMRGNIGRSLLHNACIGGSLSLVQTLIRVYNSNIHDRDNESNTSLFAAAGSGKADVTLSLINDFSCDPNIVKGKQGRSLLHFACEGGSVSLVQTLIQDHKADINARDDTNITPFNVAAIHGHEKVVNYMIDDLSCDPTMSYSNLDRPLILFACQRGSVNFIKTLVLNYKADVNACDKLNYTPLNLSACMGNAEVTLTLLNEFGCDPNVKGYLGKSLLHDACHGGNVHLVQTLIRDHNADINARDDQGITPLHLAAYRGNADVALCLIKEFGCNINTTGYFGKSLLHDACEGGSLTLVHYLLPSISVLCINNEGNTPLHICSSFGHSQCVEALLLSNAPLLLRNNRGHTPIDLATGLARSVLEQFLISNRQKRQIDYNAVLGLAEKKYSGEHAITRLFVIGDPCSGKSTLVESLKRDGFFQKIRRIPEQAVPAHTAGIVPSIHASKSLGRVIFYDFAGDPEYYSSHAAILESLASSKTGNNLIVIVVDLRKESISSILHYWFLFIQNQKFQTKLSLILIGSHSDLLSKKQILDGKNLFYKFSSNLNVEKVEHFLLDCRKPGSKKISDFQNKLSSWKSLSPKFSLSRDASLLLGLFEKDFNNVTACPMQDVLSHIEDSGVCLPIETEPLHHILSELHDIGVLLLLGAHTDDNCYVILKSSKLTNEVHKLLFSQSALRSLNDKYKGAHGYSFNIGILPDSVLKEILPPYISKQCLTYLQYCQEITSADISAFPSLTQCDPACQSFVFFPALCSVDKSSVSLSSSCDLTYTCAWLAHCSGDSDYFPSRFLHVLLLRLVFQFTLSFPAESQRQGASQDSSHFQRGCTMWKTGVHWLMTEGVECMVELVDSCKGVVVTAKSKQDTAENCVSVFNKIISCVMQAKTEFCHNISPHFFLLGSTNEEDYQNPDNQFAMSNVESALQQPEQEWVLSVSRKGRMEHSKLSCMQTVTLWHCIFPIGFTSVLHYLKGIVSELYSLGIGLMLPTPVLEEIEENNQKDVAGKRRDLVRRWMSSTSNPCWWHLVQALKNLERRDISDEIEESHGKS